MIQAGATYIGVATDHVIESFRNNVWAGYKTGEGIEPELLTQFAPLEDALRALGVMVCGQWSSSKPMTRLRRQLRKPSRMGEWSG
jgi:hypothetical protein